MKFIKKNVKLILAIFVIIITNGISIYATGEYLASQVNYTRNDSTINVSTALDNLHTIASTYKNLSQSTTASAVIYKVPKLRMIIMEI